MSEMKSTLNILNRIPIFKGLNRRQLETIAKRFVEREYAVGEAIVTQGKGGEGFFIILTGGAEAVLERLDGEKVVLNPLGENDFFGEIALLSESLRAASVITTEPTQCLVLTRWDFLSILKEDADMAVAILQELATRFARFMSTV
jgi:CRP-like cAMP-binding protein